MSMRAWVIRAVVALVLAVAAALVMWQRVRSGDPEGVAGGNGRLEAVEIHIATRWPGRVREILVNEGDFVTAGQPLAHMDTAVLEAQRREAEAQIEQARIGVEVAESMVAQRQAERLAAVAVVAQREAERDAATRGLERAEALARANTLSAQLLDDARARMRQADAAVNAAQAQVAASDAASGAARSQVVGARSMVEAGRATLQRIGAELADGTLVSPRDGRVQYRIAQPGEVVTAGGKVLSLLDLTDVYMTFFLPTQAAGRVRLGAEVRLVLDAAPQYVVPARVSFVSDVAQFTPKTVETQVERLKLMFRVKARIDPALLRAHIEDVKTGLPGVAHVKLDPAAEWPPELGLPAQLRERLGR